MRSEKVTLGAVVKYLDYHCDMYDKTGLVVTVILQLIALFLFWRKRFTPAVFTLFAAALVLHYWASSLFPYLQDWDERFHALVAKNLTHHMLLPTLFEHPVLPIVENDWSQMHIWLHKQSLFLWQIALSIKFFGANVTAVRLPSILLSSLLIPMVYRIGILVFDAETGFVATFLVSSSFNITVLSCGEMGMDHNDISFMFYVTASIWAWLEYERNHKIKWILLMGLFAGCAVLCKWLIGFVVFGIFGFSHLVIQRDIFTKRTLAALGVGTTICIIVALPWQVYILLNFPKEAAFEYYYNNIHFWIPVEGHAEDTWFYFNELKHHYHLLQVFIFTGFGAALFQNRLKLSLPLIAGIAAIYIFFTLAQTKLQNYVLVVMPLMYLFLAQGLVFTFRLSLKRLPYCLSILSVFLCMSFIFILNADVAELVQCILNNDSYAGKINSAKRVNTPVFIATNKLLSKDYIILDFNTGEEIECMFYTGNMAYSRITEDKIVQLKVKGLKIAAFESDNEPEFILKDSSILKLPFKIATR